MWVEEKMKNKFMEAASKGDFKFIWQGKYSQ